MIRKPYRKSVSMQRFLRSLRSARQFAARACRHQHHRGGNQLCKVEHEKRTLSLKILKRLTLVLLDPRRTTIFDKDHFRRAEMQMSATTFIKRGEIRRAKIGGRRGTCRPQCTNISHHQKSPTPKSPKLHTQVASQFAYPISTTNLHT